VTGDTRFCDFEPVTRDQWMERARADLRGKPLASLRRASVEGVEIDPLYTRDQTEDLPACDSMPGAYPFVRGRTALGPGPVGWETRQEYTHPNPADAATAASRDLELGAHSLHFVLAPSLRRAVRDAAGPGVVLSRQPAMARLLRDLDLSHTPIFIEVGVAGLPVVGMLSNVVGDATPGLDGGVLADPLGELAAAGGLGVSLSRALDDMTELVGWCESRAPRFAAVGVSGIPYHEAGASAVQEVGLALATGVHYLRELDRRGLSPDRVAARMVFRLAVGRELFLDVAKLRAARLAWARVCEACGVRSAEAAMRLHARGSSRARTRRDPWVNLLRGTVESFAAVVGGADAVATTRMDDAFGRSDAFSDRMALDTQVLLREESHLGAVVDPAGGSYLVEAQTHAIAEEAWRVLQRLEGEGGVGVALEKGTVREMIAPTVQARREAVAHGNMPITGVSSFALLDETPLERAPDPELPAAVRGAGMPADPAALAARLGALATSPPGAKTGAVIEAIAAGAEAIELIDAMGDEGEPATAVAVEPMRLAEPFEALRDRADAATEANGERPRVFLARMGPVRSHKARADFCRALLAAGGIDVTEDEGYASPAEAAAAASKAARPIAIVCGTDAEYPELVPALVPALRGAGVEMVVLAGKPADQVEAHRAAGIDAFVHLGMDAVAFLTEVLDRLEGAR
jgi:methylmalonyl-CoA mutase